MADMVMGGTPTNSVLPNDTLNEVQSSRPASVPDDLRASITPFSYTRFITGKLITNEHEYVMGQDFGHTL